MSLKNIIITKFENVDRTFINSGDESLPWERLASGIIIPLSGSFEFIFSDNIISVNSEKPIFIPEGAVYHFRCTKKAESVIFNFHTQQKDLQTASLPKISHKTAEEFYEKLCRLSSRPQPEEYALLSVLYDFFYRAFFDGQADSKEILVRKAERIMEEAYSDPTLTSRAVAARLNISEVYLRKLFSKKRGLPPGKSLLVIRMKNAKVLLEQGFSVGETAISAGYCDIYQFSRAFKNHFGYPPSYVTKKVPRI